MLFKQKHIKTKITVTQMNSSFLFFLIIFLEFGCAKHTNHTTHFRSSITKVSLDNSFSINKYLFTILGLSIKNLQFDFSDGVHISGYISYSDVDKCLNETNTHKIGLQCRVSTWIIKKSSFSFSKTIDSLNCTNNDINIVYQNKLALYYGCAIMNIDDSEVYDYKTIDLFKERYKCPMWVIYAAIAIGLSFIAVCFICVCCCCCKCCCPCLLCL